MESADEQAVLAGALSELAARVAFARAGAANQGQERHGRWQEPVAELVWIRECREALRLIELNAIRRIRSEPVVAAPWKDIAAALGTTTQAAHHRLRWEVLRPGRTLADLAPEGCRCRAWRVPGRYPQLPAARLLDPAELAGLTGLSYATLDRLR